MADPVLVVEPECEMSTLREGRRGGREGRKGGGEGGRDGREGVE